MAHRRIDSDRSGTLDEGSVLIVVVALTTGVLIIAAALFVLGTGESDVVEYTVDSAKAFCIAEAGQERARTWLEELSETDPPTYPASSYLTDVPLAGGTYDLDVTESVGVYPWLAEYDVVTTGEVDGVVRTVQARLRHETFAQYLYFSDQTGNISFTTGDSLDGRTHSNGQIRIDGDPWFGQRVSSAISTMLITSGSHPTFVDGYELGVKPVPFPSAAEMAASLKTMAGSGGVVLRDLAGTNARYEIELARSGAYGYLSYRGYERVGSSYSWTGWTTVNISATNGVLWTDDLVSSLKGTLDGQLTIGAGSDIHIVDDVLYRDSTPGHGPDPGCDDILGLVSAKNIIVDNTAANRTDCEIHAHMLALNTSLTVQNYTSGAVRGDLIIHGGFAQKTVGAVGQYRNSGLVHGYHKDYHYDWRLADSSPPGYPTTNRYLQIAWRER
jgi:hypothetical protein